MVCTCSALNCTTRDSKENRARGISFHKFPKNEALRAAWVKATKRAGPYGSIWIPSEYAQLCSQHFEEKDFEVSQCNRRLRTDAVPSIFNQVVRVSCKGIRGKKYVRDTESGSALVKAVNVNSTDWKLTDANVSVVCEPISHHLLDQQESSDQAPSDYPLSTPEKSDLSSDTLFEVLKRKIECFEHEKEQRDSEIQNLKLKLEHLQKENESTNFENDFLRVRVEKLAQMNASKRKQIKSLQACKKRADIRVQNLKEIINSLKENRYTDECIRSPKKIHSKKIDSCQREDLVVIGQIVYRPEPGNNQDPEINLNL